MPYPHVTQFETLDHRRRRVAGRARVAPGRRRAWRLVTRLTGLRRLPRCAPAAS